MAEKQLPEIKILANEGMSTVSLDKRLVAVYWPVGEAWWVAVDGSEPSRFDDKGEAFRSVLDAATNFDG